jgi:hypothetical protein
MGDNLNQLIDKLYEDYNNSNINELLRLEDRYGNDLLLTLL